MAERAKMAGVKRNTNKNKTYFLQFSGISTVSRCDYGKEEFMALIYICDKLCSTAKMSET